MSGHAIKGRFVVESAVVACVALCGDWHTSVVTVCSSVSEVPLLKCDGLFPELSLFCESEAVSVAV